MQARRYEILLPPVPPAAVLSASTIKLDLHGIRNNISMFAYFHAFPSNFRVVVAFARFSRSCTGSKRSNRRMQILDCFWALSSVDQEKRNEAIQSLLSEVASTSNQQAVQVREMAPATTRQLCLMIDRHECACMRILS